MINVLSKKIVTVLIILVVLGGLTIWFVYKYKQAEDQAEISVRQDQELNQQLENVPSNKQDSTITTTVTIFSLKIYRNTEWGFEFQYPDGWIVKERTFGGYYSKFNVVVRPTSGWYSQFPILVNIVLPEFAERSFQGLEKTISEVTVSGVLGIKYQYEFEGSQETAIILPIGEYKMILGTDGRHEDIFNQVVSTFKFLK